MDKYQETFETWNNIASLYEDLFMHVDIYNESYDSICHALTKPHASLLEIGCGPGNISQYLLAKRPDFNLFGIDIAPNMIDLARKNNPTARFAVMDSREIGTLEETFDAVIVGFCFPYLSPAESAALLKSAYNLLNDHGVIYLSFVEGNPDESAFKEGSGGRVYFYFHELASIIKQLRDAGFQQPEVSKVPFKRSATMVEMHTILLAKK